MTDTLALPGTLVLAGAGKMGGAMLRGWLEAGAAPERVVLLDPAPSDEMASFARERGLRLNPDMGALAGEGIAVIVLAVKPQMMAEAGETLAPLMADKPLLVSIAAGKTVDNIASAIGEAPTVRSMPNTPAAVGRGITAAFAGPGVSKAQRELAAALLAAVGEVVWLDDEGLMDAVTAVSGSGPAYVYLLTECLADAAREVGLPGDLADALARATVTGAGELLYRSPDAPSTLRQNVTSPGGTTAAALEVLMADDGMAPLLAKAVKRARDRARDLSG